MGILNRMTHLKPAVIVIILVVSSLMTVISIGHKRKSYIQKTIPYTVLDDTENEKWHEDFIIVKIKSSKDGVMQNAYAYQTTSKIPQPLIVSLHTWNGDYRQNDKFKNLVRENNWNYIHPDFRGPNKNFEACVSDFVIQDIDDSIDFALSNFNCDKEKIYIVGVSGGGYAALASFMKSKHNVAEFSAWVPISDVYWWHHETKVRGLNYWKDILKCTNSSNEKLDEIIAKSRSPIYWKAAKEKLTNTKLKIYAGVYDGIQGSVPITQSINFYNKILADIDCYDTEKFVNDKEIIHLLTKQTPIGSYGQIGKRKIILKKECKNVKITIFDGEHEMMTDVVLQTLND